MCVCSYLSFVFTPSDLVKMYNTRRCKLSTYLLLMTVVCIVVLLLNYILMKYEIHEDSSMSNDLHNNQLSNMSLNYLRRMLLKNLSMTCPNVSKNSIIYHKQPPNVQKTQAENHSYALTLERRTSCNLANPENCFHTKKSLVITFWSEQTRQRWLSKHLLSSFPEKYYDYIVMVHDRSTWNNFSGYEKIIWIHVPNQVKFWYIKRFLSPHIFRAYHYIWVLDDDVRFEFNPRAYECVSEKYNIILSAPARGEGVVIYKMTRVKPRYTSRIGRWTNFIEIGPMFTAKSSVFICLWNVLSEMNGFGFGLDWKWCGILSEYCGERYPLNRLCAILDSFVVHHDSQRINTVKEGLREKAAYNKYMKYLNKPAAFEAIASDSTQLNLCNKNISRS